MLVSSMLLLSLSCKVLLLILCHDMYFLRDDNKHKMTLLTNACVFAVSEDLHMHVRKNSDGCQQHRLSSATRIVYPV